MAHRPAEARQRARISERIIGRRSQTQETSRNPKIPAQGLSSSIFHISRDTQPTAHKSRRLHIPSRYITNRVKEQTPTDDLPRSVSTPVLASLPLEVVTADPRRQEPLLPTNPCPIKPSFSLRGCQPVAGRGRRFRAGSCRSPTAAPRRWQDQAVLRARDTRASRADVI